LEDRPVEWSLANIAVSCCTSRQSPSEITAEERSLLWEFRHVHCGREFDGQSSEANEWLLGVWRAVYPQEDIDVIGRDKRWTKLGFQSANPRTDVRSGSFALEQLYFIASHYPERTRQLAKQAEELDYPFAVCCFNVSHLSTVFFDLLEVETVGPVPNAELATREQLKNFLRLCRICPHGARTVIDELFFVLVEKLHEIWKELRAEKNCNLMDFPEAMRKVYNVQAKFWSTPRMELADLRALLVS
jgi:hypothetical protein